MGTNKKIKVEEKLHVFKYLKARPRILINLICMVIIFCANSFCYYLISFQLKYLNGSIYINNLVSGISEMAAYALSGILFKYFSIKKIWIMNYILALAGMLSYIYFQTDNQYLISIFILGSKFGISSSMNGGYLANNVLFPTAIISTSFGVCNIFARLATVFAPFVAELKPEVISERIFCGTVMFAIVAAAIVK